MTSEERHYLIARAEREIELAERSTSARAVHVHYVIASAYLERAYGEASDSARPPAAPAMRPTER